MSLNAAHRFSSSHFLAHALDIGNERANVFSQHLFRSVDLKIE